MDDVRDEGASGPFQRERRVEPYAVVLFGATGDLARRKLVPGLHRLSADGLLPEGFALIGVARSAADVTELRAVHEEALRRAPRPALDADSWRRFAATIDYVRGDLDDARTYVALRQALAAADSRRGTEGNRLYYFAVPPSSFATILARLREHGLLREPAAGGPWSRVMIEKPFGRDLASARALNRMAASYLDESQLYRIDHYLGKETVQNILVFRFANAIFEPLWNRKYIDHVQITAAEEIGVEGRGRFYEETGVLRDVVQNHLLEVLALTAMEPPISWQPDDQRDARVAVLRSIRPFAAGEVAAATVRAQYGGYRDEPHVAPASRTPTYAAVRLLVDNWRWHGVPFYLRAGKRLARRMTEVAVHFQRMPLCLFGKDEVCQSLDANVLTLRLQPDEGIDLRFVAKRPGEDLAVRAVEMDFAWARSFAEQPAEAYERLLLDCMRGDPSLFARRDSVERAWEVMTPILEAWEKDEPPLAGYAPGSDGPAEADALMTREGRRWRSLT
jgi:glucose-6-phosphate 1-dehydrogenase